MFLLKYKLYFEAVFHVLLLLLKLTETMKAVNQHRQSCVQSIDKMNRKNC